MVASVGTFDVHLPLTRTASPPAAGVIVGGRIARDSAHEGRDFPARGAGAEAPIVGGGE